MPISARMHENNFGEPFPRNVWKYGHICVEACTNLHGLMTTSTRRHAQSVWKNAHTCMEAYPNFEETWPHLHEGMATSAQRYGNIYMPWGHGYICMKTRPHLCGDLVHSNYYYCERKEFLKDLCWKTYLYKIV